MSTLKVNKLRDTAGSADAITLDPNGGAVLAGVTTVTSVKVGAAVTISESGIEASGIGITCANINGTQIGGRRNLIINGAMQVAQRGTSQASITSSGYYNIDRYRTALNTGTVTTSQSTDVPTGEGFSKSFKVDVTTADTSLSGTNFLHVQQSIEGQNLQGLAYGTSGAKTITLSFFVRSNKTGIYCISLEKTDNTRYDYTAEYTINSADTWEKKIITIAPDSNIKAAAGAIDNDNGKGFNLKFCLAAGGDRDNGTNNTWNTGTNHSTSNQVNLLDSTSNEWYLTGVQLEVGSQATSFEHRSYGDELALCQRYYYRQVAGDNEFFRGMAMADVDGNSIELNSPFPTTMRIAPTAIEQTGTASNYKIRRSTTATCTSVPSFGHATTDQLQCRFTKSSHGFGDGSAVRCASGTSGAYIGVSAEL